MWDWLTSPIDPSRAHEITAVVAWHSRSMFLAWAVLAPLAVIVARFFKIRPGQNWPEQLDSGFWWRSHWIGQSLVLALTLLGLFLALVNGRTPLGLHSVFGYSVLLALTAQVLLGFSRGSKGGPTAPAPDGSWRGHHYDMTPWRRMFEALHKSLGYGLLLLSALTILFGFWKANAPVWMWLLTVLWWLFLVATFILLQRRGMAIDTYQAIWGDDPSHPGNQGPAPGWGVRRRGHANRGGAGVRQD